ncbi:TPA: hypothetical protein HA244_02555 [Candidatus Micrarchaeota archaeon]|nr:hypothetical protein [Candidatus Micrarchaeota archaeon]
MDFSSMDFTKLAEWDELLIVAGIALILLGEMNLGFWVAVLGGAFFLASEGYLNF